MSTTFFIQGVACSPKELTIAGIGSLNCSIQEKDNQWVVSAKSDLADLKISFEKLDSETSKAHEGLTGKYTLERKGSLLERGNARIFFGVMNADPNLLAINATPIKEAQEEGQAHPVPPSCRGPQGWTMKIIREQKKR